MRPDQLVHNTDMNIMLYCRFVGGLRILVAGEGQRNRPVREGVRKSFGAVRSRVTVAGSVAGEREYKTNRCRL